MKQDGLALKRVPLGMRGDREVVLEAVRQNADAFGFVWAGLRGDKEVVMEAVRLHGEALQAASDELRNDKDVVLLAVKTGPGRSGLHMSMNRGYV